MASNATKERFEKLQKLCRAGRYDEADSVVMRALQVTPKDINLLHLAATIAEGKRNPTRAVMFLRRALAQKPDWSEAQFNLAR